MKKREIKKTNLNIEEIKKLLHKFHQTKKDRDFILKETLTHARKILGADAVCIWDIEEKTGFLKIDTAVGLSQGFIRYFNKTDRLRPGKTSIMGQAMALRKTLFSYKVVTDKRIKLDRWREMIIEEKIASILSVPLFFGAETIGTLNLYNKKNARRFGAKEIEVAEIIAYHFSLFLAREKVLTREGGGLQKIESYKKQIFQLRDLTSFLSLSLKKSFQKSLRIIIEEILEEFKGSGVALFQKENEKLHLVETYGFSQYGKDFLSGNPFQISSSIPSCIAFNSQQIKTYSQVLTEEGIEKSWKILMANEGFVAECAFPLTVSNRKVGILGVYYPQKREYAAEELSILDTIAHGFAVSLENLRAFLSLSAEQRKTLAMVNNLTDGVLLFDRNNLLASFNPMAETFFNIKAENVMGKNISELGKLPTLEPLIGLINQGTEGVFRKEIQTKTNLILEVSMVPMAIKDEKLGTLVIIHDITREKGVEKMKTEFVTISAHQLRTPISGIKWILTSLMEGDFGKMTVEQNEVVGKAYQSNERMVVLINDLLNVSRIEEGKYVSNPVLSSMEDIILTALNNLKELAASHKVEVNFQKPEKAPPKVKVDEEKMGLVVENLMSNAIKYTPEGGKVDISLKLDNENIEVIVKDTGVGIIKEQQERIFGKFFRGRNVTRMETDGSGLGLFIAKNIVSAHGGKIWFESEEGKGTTFHFSIPLVRSEEAIKKF
ncbi:MAG: ATP-binding protein [Candidatus Parcubacteria bacterium]|nr:ATP-binding protein [Candidatus Parcubacteria bacterium]